MKPRLLILSDPPMAPGYLPRLRYLCDYLYEQGYSMHLYTERKSSLDFAHDYPITTIPVYTGSTVDWLIKSIWSLLTNWHERYFAKAVARTIAEQTYDAVVCTTFSTFPLGAAVQIAHLRHIPLIADIRDVDEQVDHSTYQYEHQQWWLRPGRWFYRAIQLHRRNQALRQADVVTTVSPWHVDFLKTFNPNVHLIYNGFDPRQFYHQDIPVDKFRITYIGSFFAFHHPEPLYQAVQELNLPDVEVCFHTPTQDPVPHTQIGNTIRHSSIMLVLTSTQTHGMMTTKFSEILGCEKPLICIPSDQGCLAEAIRQTHAGIATDSIDEIKAFIQAQYQEWKQQGYTHQKVRKKDMFNRLNIMQQLDHLLSL